MIYRALVGVLVTIVTFTLWRTGVFIESQLTEHTPLYYAIHWWASVIVPAVAGAMAALWPWEDF